MAANKNTYDFRQGGHFAIGLFSGLLICIFGFIAISLSSADLFSSSEFFSALVGGLLAGLIALASTLVANAHQDRLSVMRKRDEDAAFASTIYVKLHEARDSIVKSYRHHFDGSASNFVSYGYFGQISKPLAFSQIDRVISESELAFVFRRGSASVFNDLADADRTMRLFNQLTAHYELAFSNFENHIRSNNQLTVDGAMISGNVSIDPFELLKIEDARNVLKSFLLRASSDFSSVHERYIQFLDEELGVKIDFVILEDVAAAAPNHFYGFHGGGR